MAMRDNKSPLAADAVLAMKCRRDNRVTLSSFISDESLCLDRSKLPCGYQFANTLIDGWDRLCKSLYGVASHPL